MSERLLLEFYKYQGAGNDFVLIDGRYNPVEDPCKISQILCERHFSVGADTLLYLEDSSSATIRMRVCEIDGSESNMCGNGLRCIGLYMFEHFGLSEITVETLGGTKKVLKDKDYFIASMGEMKEIGNFMNPPSKRILEEKDIHGFHFFVVSPSEPHAVTIVEDIGLIDEKLAISVMRFFEIFPFGINVNFVELGEKFIKVRTFERGLWSETLACGTGATSAAFVARSLYGFNENIEVHMKGGILKVFFKDGEAYLEGDARFVFKGEIEVEIK